MDAINSQPGMGPQLYAVKKATEVQEQSVLKLLESAQTQSAQLQKSSASELTGIGQNLDIKA
ncbi:MAG: hypothetical protein U9Q62_08745 [Campylobacterota bacterium]|nr:hypothetical protein [Campylobacterota bacterium]